MKYKVGDRVKVNGKDGATDEIIGKIFTVKAIEEFRHPHPYKLQGRYENFCDKELTLVEKGNGTMSRRSFRLLRSTPEVRKGAVFQEACDDGDQEYVLLDDSFIIPQDFFDFFSKMSLSRGTVEEQPNWYEEVYETKSEFVTKEELNAFKKFKVTLNKRKGRK